MNLRFRALSTLTALAFTCAASAAWAGDLGPESRQALQRAELLIGQKQYKNAAAEFERASELAGGSCPECLLGVARAYSGAGRQEAAIQVTRMALTLTDSPATRAQGYDQLGSFLTLKGEVAAARAAFQKAVELDGSLAGQVRSSLAQALLQRVGSAGSVDIAAGPAGGTESFATVAAPRLP